MKRSVRALVAALLFLFVVAASVEAQQVVISALDGVPLGFVPGQSIDLAVALMNDGEAGDGYDIVAYHGGRAVASLKNQRLDAGQNSFKLKDTNLRGFSGSYVVRIEKAGSVVAEQAFTTKATRDNKIRIVRAKTKSAPGQTVTGQSPTLPLPPPVAGMAIQLANMESIPPAFTEGQPMGFLVVVQNGGQRREGVDVAVYFQGRLVVRETGQALVPGANRINLRDASFKARQGTYSAKVSSRGATLSEKSFTTRALAGGKFTLDPQ